MLPTKVIQTGQKLAQERVIGKLLEPGAAITDEPTIVKLLYRCPRLRRIPGQFIVLGIRRERVLRRAVRAATPDDSCRPPEARSNGGHGLQQRMRAGWRLPVSLKTTGAGTPHIEGCDRLW